HNSNEIASVVSLLALLCPAPASEDPGSEKHHRWRMPHCFYRIPDTTVIEDKAMVGEIRLTSRLRIVPIALLLWLFAPTVLAETVLTLRADFVERYKNRITIDADYIVDKAHA